MRPWTVADAYTERHRGFTLREECFGALPVLLKDLSLQHRVSIIWDATCCYKLLLSMPKRSCVPALFSAALSTCSGSMTSCEASWKSPRLQNTTAH